MEMLPPLVTELMIKAIMPVAKVMVPLVMVVKIFLILMVVNEAKRCDWVVIFWL
jgi:hypothetical protein